MCCFSGPVERVADTSIFARSVEKGRQLLVYSMTIAAKTQVAMILPLPVPPGSPDDAVRFVDLKGYPEFFPDLKQGFPEPKPRSLVGAVRAAPAAAAEKAEPLVVVQVGDFEASFVPAIKDFGRLDPRFRLPDQTWESLPAYKEYGFAVFKLREGATTIHPMAFEFPRADASKVFFPTVHIHDGKVHEDAEFDHALYCQKREEDKTSLPEWRESPLLASAFMNVAKSQGIINGNAHCYLRKIKGKQKNQDTIA
ncbi:MAG: hypothetical protein HY293_10140 [Planctomycetes bacterium]|nr:hypothetical protein [Planctomycetota bacterium]